MNTYQIMGTMTACTVVFAGVVTFLTMQGVHILLVITGVYFVAVWTMLCMQRRARANFESKLNAVKNLAQHSSRRSEERGFRQAGNVTSLYEK